MSAITIPFVDLRAQYAAIGPEIDAAIGSVISSCAFIGGKYVRDFEDEFARYCGVSHAVGVSSGTSALHLALLACGVGPGDEVVTVSHTFIATAEAVSLTGATPVLVDVMPGTGCMDPDRIEAAVTDATRAILPVHLYGQPADMEKILGISKRHGLSVIGDAAQAHGASTGGRPVSSLGRASCFSFYPGKNLGAYGDAGAIVTDDDEIARTVRKLRDHGRQEKYTHDRIGFNYRIDGLQAAILSVKLRHLDEWTAARQRHAARYRDGLAGTSGITLMEHVDHAPSVHHLMVVRSNDRDGLREHLAARGVASGIHYPVPVHLQPAYADLGSGPGALPVSELLASTVLSLPMFPELSDAQIDQVCDAVKEWARSR